MRARRKLQDKFANFEQGLSQLQSFLIKNKDDWRHEVSTFDQRKDTNYKPAFLKELMDKYSWGADAIAEVYSALKKAPLKIELSEEKLATLLIQSSYFPWVQEFTTLVYNNEELKSKIIDKDLSPELKTALASGDWVSIKKSICANVIGAEHPAAKEVGHRYLLGQALKQVTLKPKQELEKAKEEAEKAGQGSFLTVDDVKAAFQKLKEKLEQEAGRELSIDEIVDRVIGEQEAKMNELIRRDQVNQFHKDLRHELGQDTDQTATEIAKEGTPGIPQSLLEEMAEEPIETEGKGTTDQNTPSPENAPIVDVLDTSNTVPFPYKNFTPEPADVSVTFLAPGRPNEMQPNIADPFRNVSPENFKHQYL